jgi:hypothetical protein
MAVWVRLIAVTCLVGLARWASAQLCPVTDAERYQRTAPLVTQAELGFSEDSSPLHNAVYHYDLPRIKCQVDQAQVRPPARGGLGVGAWASQCARRGPA